MKIKDKLLVTAIKKVIGMAYSRTEFKNKIEEKIGGAFYEYLKAAYTKTNGETRWVDHWNSEVDRLLDTELVVVLLHTATFKNRLKATTEVIIELKKVTNNYKASAKKQLELSYFKKPFKKDLDEKQIQSFFDRVEKILASHVN